MKTELFEAFFELIYEQSLEKVNCANDVVYLCYRKISISRNVDERSNKITSTLRLNGTEQHDSGHYSCQVITLEF